MIIRRLEAIIDDPPKIPSDFMKYYLTLVKEHDDAANKLPKDISRKNIINYAEKVRNREAANLDNEIEWEKV